MQWIGDCLSPLAYSRSKKAVQTELMLIVNFSTPSLKQSPLNILNQDCVVINGITTGLCKESMPGVFCYNRLFQKDQNITTSICSNLQIFICPALGCQHIHNSALACQWQFPRFGSLRAATWYVIQTVATAWLVSPEKLHFDQQGCILLDLSCL